MYQSETGPYRTVAEAASAAMPRAVVALSRVPGTREEINRAAQGLTMDALLVACTAAGVALGDYDRHVLRWLADRGEPDVAQVFVGLLHRAADAGKAAMHRNIMRPHRFHEGPWAGRGYEQPRAFGVGQHCMPGTDTPGVASTWADADSWPGQDRYAPSGIDDDGDTVIMVWRQATAGEIAMAQAAAAARQEERALDDAHLYGAIPRDADA